MTSSAVDISTIFASSHDPRRIDTSSRVHPRDFHDPRYTYVHRRRNAELRRREVPQEHSHEKFITKTREMLNLDNPNKIVDPIFGLLGNADGSAGRGSITNTDCLQQAIADQAFTNAKAVGDVDGMIAALIFRALERNTGKVGLASVPCTTLEAVNQEIAVIKQHQDPASNNAVTINFKIVINLAIQIASIGGDPTLALLSGTFAPGNTNDSTAAGNTCDSLNDAEGCIYTQNLLVEDASVDDIISAVAAAGMDDVVRTNSGTATSGTSGTGGTSNSSDSTDLSAPSTLPRHPTDKSRDWKQAEVVAPTVTISVIIAAVAIWWYIRRLKQERLKKRMEEKAEWLKPEFGKMMRARMMALDTSKTERLDGDNNEETGAGAGGVEGKGKWVGGQTEVGRDGDRRKKILSSLSAIKRDLRGSGMADRVSRINNSPYSQSRQLNASENGSRGDLTTIPSAKVNMKKMDRDGGFGWKVFRGNKEIIISSYT